MSAQVLASGPDLLDFLAEIETTAVVHCILPNMSIACGEDLIALCQRQRAARTRRMTTTTTETTCPDCLAVGDLRALSRAMNGQQATER